MNGGLPSLPAKQASWVRRLLSDEDLLNDVVQTIASPLHLLHPNTFDANVAAFRTALQVAGVMGIVYYAKKANKGACWLERCADLHVGVDVASIPELRDALAHGVPGSDLMVTGPAKSTDLLTLAVRHDCVIAVDSLDELARLLDLERRTRIVLRCHPPGTDSRFGLTGHEITLALDTCTAPGAAVDMLGFSFHLSGYDVAPRAEMAAALVELCARARQRGLAATLLSIGGGFAVDYVDAQAWRDFLTHEHRSWYHAGKKFDGFYPYHSPVAGAAMLTAILDTVPTGHDRPLATLLRESGVTLAIEPGRSLLDQAGCTIFTVQGLKDREHGILTVDGTSLSLSEQWFASEFLPDPVLVPRRSGTPFAASVGGASCLESDMLTWRRVVFPRRPVPGDRLVYLNTAGYQMDSNESAFHGLPLPVKVVLHDEDTRFRWRLDRTSK